MGAGIYFSFLCLERHHLTFLSTAGFDRCAEIQASLEGLRGQITLIVIAHRLSTIRSADKIIILDRGRMVATGAHDRLLDECDEYRILVGGQRL